MGINNRSLGGQPNLPYADFQAYAGVDSFLQCTFLDRTGALVVPTSINFRLDDLSNDVPMIPSTPVTVTGAAQEIQLPAASLVMTNQVNGSQICQCYITAVLPDGTTAATVAILELIGVATPN